jgi:hypothetical protein
MAERPVGGLGTCAARAKRGRSDAEAEAHDPLHQAKRFHKVQEVRGRSKWFRVRHLAASRDVFLASAPQCLCVSASLAATDALLSRSWPMVCLA